MKALIFIILFITSAAHAERKNWCVLHAEGPWCSGNLNQCKDWDKGECLDATACPIDECSPTDIEVPDHSKPERVTKEEPCEDEAACQELIADGDFCDSPEHQFFWGDRNEDGDLEAWCTRPDTKIIQELRPDQTKISDKERRRQEREQKRQEKEKVVTDLKTYCAENVKQNDPFEVGVCKALVGE